VIPGTPPVVRQTASSRKIKVHLPIPNSNKADVKIVENKQGKQFYHSARDSLLYMALPYWQYFAYSHT
jgi:hypothetical protein